MDEQNLFELIPDCNVRVAVLDLQGQFNMQMVAFPLFWTEPIQSQRQRAETIAGIQTRRSPSGNEEITLNRTFEKKCSGAVAGLTRARQAVGPAVLLDRSIVFDSPSGRLSD